MKYIVNSAVITTPGEYRYSLITTKEAREWIEKADPFPLCTIAYQETAKALGLLTGHDFPVNRRQIFMSPGDEALVFRLTCRLNDPSLKGRLTPDFVLKNCEIGLLSKKGKP